MIVDCILIDIDDDDYDAVAVFSDRIVVINNDILDRCHVISSKIVMRPVGCRVIIDKTSPLLSLKIFFNGLLNISFFEQIIINLT